MLLCVMQHVKKKIKNHEQHLNSSDKIFGLAWQMFVFT